MPAARAALPFVLLVAFVSAACREEGEIKISSLEFEGVSQVDKGALANALKTKKGSRFPGAASATSTGALSTPT